MRVVAGLIPAMALVLLLAGCGVRRDLRPKEGHSLPPAPYGREQPRAAAALMSPMVQAAPERSVELRKRSEERADDPFDLPPSGK